MEPAVHVVNMMIVSPSVCKGDNLGGGKLREVPSVCQRENPSVHEVGEHSIKVPLPIFDGEEYGKEEMCTGCVNIPCVGKVLKMRKC